MSNPEQEQASAPHWGQVAARVGAAVGLAVTGSLIDGAVRPQDSLLHLDFDHTYMNNNRGSAELEVFCGSDPEPCTTAEQLLPHLSLDGQSVPDGDLRQALPGVPDDARIVRSGDGYSITWFDDDPQATTLELNEHELTLDCECSLHRADGDTIIDTDHLDLDFGDKGLLLGLLAFAKRPRRRTRPEKPETTDTEPEPVVETPEPTPPKPKPTPTPPKPPKTPKPPKPIPPKVPKPKQPKPQRDHNWTDTDPYLGGGGGGHVKKRGRLGRWLDERRVHKQQVAAQKLAVKRVQEREARMQRYQEESAKRVANLRRDMAKRQQALLRSGLRQPRSSRTRQFPHVPRPNVNFPDRFWPALAGTGLAALAAFGWYKLDAAQTICDVTVDKDGDSWLPHFNGDWDCGNDSGGGGGNGGSGSGGNGSGQTPPPLYLHEIDLNFDGCDTQTVSGSDGERTTLPEDWLDKFDRRYKNTQTQQLENILNLEQSFNEQPS